MATYKSVYGDRRISVEPMQNDSGFVIKIANRSKTEFPTGQITGLPGIKHIIFALDAAASWLYGPDDYDLDDSPKIQEGLRRKLKAAGIPMIESEGPYALKIVTDRGDDRIVVHHRKLVVALDRICREQAIVDAAKPAAPRTLTDVVAAAVADPRVLANEGDAPPEKVAFHLGRDVVAATVDLGTDPSPSSSATRVAMQSIADHPAVDILRAALKKVTGITQPTSGTIVGRAISAAGQADTANPGYVLEGINGLEAAQRALATQALEGFFDATVDRRTAPATRAASR